MVCHHPVPGMLILLDTMNQSSPALGKFAARQGLARKRSETELAVPLRHAPSDPLFVIGKPCNAPQQQVYLECLIAKLRVLFSVKLDPSLRSKRLKAISSQKNAFPFVPKEHAESPQIDMQILALCIFELVLG